MGTGIIICGLNGAGKSTIGKALAQKLDFHFLITKNYISQRQTLIIPMLPHVPAKKLNNFFLVRLKRIKILYSLL